MENPFLKHLKTACSISLNGYTELVMLTPDKLHDSLDFRLYREPGKAPASIQDSAENSI